MTRTQVANRELGQRLAQRALALVRIPSVTGQEGPLADHLAEWSGTQPTLGPHLTRLGNSLVLGRPDNVRPCLALVGHLDTVPPADLDPMPHLDGDRVVGRGSSDMKAGIAVMQALVEDLDLETLPFCLVLVLYDGEEGPYDQSGLAPLLSEPRLLQEIDLAVLMEPTDNTLQLGCLGAIHARVTFAGHAAHSARPWEGENAIHKAGPLLAQLDSETVRPVRIAGLTFRESMSVTLAHGGIARNVLPDRFELNLSYRFAASPDIPTAIQAARAAIDRVARGASVQILDVAPPGSVPSQNRLVDHLRRHGDLAVHPKEAWTDVARFAAHGIDAVNFGPGASSQAHQAGEWVSIDALVASYEILHESLTTPLARALEP